MKSNFALVTLILLFFGVRHAAAQAPFAPLDAKVLHIGAVAPDLPYLRLSDGQAGSLTTSHKGKILVLEFWATWCAPCQPAMDELQKTAARFAGQKDKIEFLTVSVDGVEDKDKGPALTGKRPDLVEKVTAHVKQKGWVHTINAWCGNDVRKTWPIHVVPMTIVLGADGRIIVANPEKKLEDVIAPLLASTADSAAPSYRDFDQTPGKGWRAFAGRKEFGAAAQAIESFLTQHPDLNARNKANLRFHAAQCLAIEGSTANIASALVHLGKAQVDPEPPDIPLRWNDYVIATEAFLKSDLVALRAARERIASGPKLNGEDANLEVVDRLIAKMGRSYAEAYLANSNEKNYGSLFKPGTQAPPLPYLRLNDGEMVSLANTHRGKIVVIEFWATWCGPCQQAMADFQKTAAKFAGRKDKIDFLTISIDGNDEADPPKIPAAIDKVVAHLKQKGWTQAINGWSAFEELKEWRIRAVPTTYVIGADGKVVVADPERRLDDFIPELLKR